MAQMIPHIIEDDNNSYGERKVFNALKKLPDDYIVFHSVRWNDRNEKRTVVWGESDFTILHPKNGIIVIEVKSGGIRCVDHTWTSIRTDNGEQNPMKDPLKQAGRSKYRFIDIISDISKMPTASPNPQYCMVEAAVWFPSISKRDVIGEMPMDYRPEIVLFEQALESPQKYIEGIYNFYGGCRHTRMSKEFFEKIRDSFAPYYCAMASLKSKRLEQEEAFVRLTKQQSALLDYLEEQRTAAIQGAAGTGKTWLALEKAKRLSNNGRVLFLCFNQFLRLYLADIKEEDPKNYQNIDFFNLPQLACKKLGVPSVEKEDILRFLDRHDDYNWEYEHIIIDEGQDFHDGEIEKLNDIALLQEGAFYVFFDRNQFVQGQEYPQWLANSECRLVLSINCRNTFAIADTSGKPVNVEPKVKNESVKGDMPKLYMCNTRAEAQKKLSVLIDQYRSNGYAYNQICILTIKTETASFLQGVDKVGNHKIRTTRDDSGVLFTTARKFKGLEADVIIIIDMDADTFSSDESKRLFYVGASRAKHNLDIVFINNSTDALERMVSHLSVEKFPSPIIGIARCLNVKLIPN